MEKEIFLIVGLGNPGDKYAHTRHNAGFEVLDRLERRYGVSLRKRLLLPGRIAEIARPDGRKLVLCEPSTFMNNSGECVAKLLARYKCAPDRLLVVCDDIDLPPAKVRVRKSGGPGTHNGMRSIISCIGTDQFARVRVGVGDRPKGGDLVAWVLGHYPPEEKEKMEAAFDLAADCAADWAEKGVDAAMRHNGESK